MDKVQATALRPGMVVSYNEQPHRILSFQHRTPGKGNAVVQVKLRGILTGVQTETRLMSTEFMERVSISGRKMQYLYQDGDGWVFMDSQNYEQITLTSDTIAAEVPWLTENMDVVVQYVADQPTGVELPKVIEIEVTQTEPPMKGATASASPKPATLRNGQVIKVPNFIEAGALIRVDPVEGRYVERAR